MRLVVFGYGFTAAAFVAAHRGRFARVTATVRSPEKAARLEAEGIEARVFGPGDCDPGIADDLAGADLLLVSAPPRGRDPVLAAFGPAILAASRLGSILYLSTVGVYGDRGGAWVDEDTVVDPVGRSADRVAAEEAWLRLGRDAGKAVGVFRLAGIYGPGRSAFDKLADGTARRIVKPGQVFNRIHVADIAEVLGAALDRPRAGAIYNVADDEPAPPQDVIAYAAKLAGVPPPPEVPFQAADFSPMGASFWAECKRVANRRIKDELGVRLRYPTYREGLRAIWQARGEAQAARRLADGSNRRGSGA